MLVTFARPEESGPFLAHLTDRRKERCGDRCLLAGTLAGVRVLVLHTGIGAEVAASAAEAALAQYQPSHWIAAGFAGGLDPGLQAGDTLTHRPDSAGTGRIISRSSPVETVEAKAALFRETGAAAVDMETEAFIAVSRMVGVPLLVVRAISDSAAEPLPLPFAVWFDVRRQRPRPLRLLAHLATHPSRIAPFARFVRALPRVAEALAAAVVAAVSTEDSGVV